MNRSTIRFRAWDTTKQKMFYDGTNVLNMPGFIYQQITGIKDINNNDVWEGDIVKVGIETGFNSITYEIGVIEYLDDRAMFVVKHPTKQMYAPMGEGTGKPNIESIGNIYETPRLLETL